MSSLFADFFPARRFASGLLLAGLSVGVLAQTSWSSGPQADTPQPLNEPSSGVYSTQFNSAICPGCGYVSAITVAEKPGDSNAVGMIAGGVAGALLGRQVGGGLGKDLATVAGAVGGAYAGKKIQENMGISKVWTVSVKYPDGKTSNFEFAQDPGLAVGDTVRNSGNSVVRR